MSASTAAFAQASQTWVSGVGDDVNPCSRTAPCKTFQGAISKTAAGGEISALDSAGFGAVTITKSITINGMGLGAGVLVSGTNGIIINAGANDVVRLIHLQINGLNGSTTNIGIRHVAGGSLIVDDVLVQGFGTGIETTLGNSIVTRSLIVRNTSFGLKVLGGSMTVENTTLTRNNVGVQADGTGTLRLSNTDIYGNQTGIGCGGGTIASANNNHKGGNSGGSVATCLPTTAVTVF
jgi:hypothetical protein